MKDITMRISALEAERVTIDSRIFELGLNDEDTSRFDVASKAIEGEIASLKAEEIRRNSENSIIAEENYLLGYSRRR